MTDRKILVFILLVIIYCLYSIQSWFVKSTVTEDVENAILPLTEDLEKAIIQNADIEVIENKTQTNQTEVNTTQNVAPKMKKKLIPLFLKDACSILQIFTERPNQPWRKIKERIDNSAVTAVCLTVYLMILVVHAVLDAINAKEEQRAKLKLNPGGERRPSLAEFANKKHLRRESSKFGLQLFQISESAASPSGEEKKERQQRKPYTRGESTNSYLTDKKSPSDTSAPASVGEPLTEPRLTKRQSVSKLIGLSDN